MNCLERFKIFSRKIYSFISGVNAVEPHEACIYFVLVVRDHHLVQSVEKTLHTLVFFGFFLSAAGIFLRVSLEIILCVHWICELVRPLKVFSQLDFLNQKGDFCLFVLFNIISYHFPTC